MRKLVSIVIVLALAIGLIGCGGSVTPSSSKAETKETTPETSKAETSTEDHAEKISEAAQDLKEDLDDLKDDLSGKVGNILGDLNGKFSESYEDIYNEYGQKLLESYEKAKTELQAEIDSGKGIEDIADKYVEKGMELAQINLDGLQQMVNLTAINPLTSDQYTEWGTKLDDLYTKYMKELSEQYSDGSIDSFSTNIEGLQPEEE